MCRGEIHHEPQVSVSIARRRLTEYEELLFLSGSRPLPI